MTQTIFAAAAVASSIGHAPSGMVMMPKVRQDGSFKETAIDPNCITGVEPSEVIFKGKKYSGAKVYTAIGFFKVLSNPNHVLLAQCAAKMTPLPVTVDSLVAIPAYTATQKMLSDGK